MRQLLELIDRLDQAFIALMHGYGHRAHRVALGLLFIWYGLLKQFGVKTTTSILAHTIYFGEPDTMVLLLGWWEVAIGVCLVWLPLARVALLLMAIRLPGTVLALILKADVCWVHFPFAPTPEGQYLFKDIVVLTAAMVIGGTIRHVKVDRVLH